MIYTLVTVMWFTSMPMCMQHLEAEIAMLGPVRNVERIWLTSYVVTSYTDVRGYDCDPDYKYTEELISTLEYDLLTSP